MKKKRNPINISVKPNRTGLFPLCRALPPCTVINTFQQPTLNESAVSYKQPCLTSLFNLKVCHHKQVQCVWPTKLDCSKQQRKLDWHSVEPNVSAKAQEREEAWNKLHKSELNPPEICHICLFILLKLSETSQGYFHLPESTVTQLHLPSGRFPALF